MTARIGTCGWMYRHWRGTFYPEGVPQKQWLESYAERFATVESNNAFYKLPEGSTFQAWADRTLDDFVMAVKVSRYLTHIKRLNDPEEPVLRFLDRAGRLGPKLGPVLLQLPPSLEVDVGRLRRVLELIPRGIRVAVEFRHRSWDTAAVRETLTEAGAALCLADRHRVLAPTWRTASWGYVRFHGGNALPRGCYTSRSIGAWAKRIAGTWSPDEDVFVYFNNDFHACAPHDAILLAAELDRAGYPVTRVPRLDEVTLG